MDSLGEPHKRCRKCRLDWPLRDFRSNPDTRTRRLARERAICRRCEITARNDVDPLVRKARDTIRRHAKRYSERLGEKLTTPEFAKRFGWDVKRIVHMFRHAWANTCRYCRQPYQTMPDGYAAMTLDVLDPAKPPYLTNVEVACRTCNTAKGDMDAAQFGEWLKGWERWKSRPVDEDIRFEQKDFFPRPEDA